MMIESAIVDAEDIWVGSRTDQPAIGQLGCLWTILDPRDQCWKVASGGTELSDCSVGTQEVFHPMAGQSKDAPEQRAVMHALNR